MTQKLIFLKWKVYLSTTGNTGLPHYGSLLSSIPKDLFPRYWTMKGYRVRRVWGWDCHGLPAENKVENKLGIKRKKDIEEKVGVKKFIDECKLYVGQVSSEWEWYVDHIARWVDFKNAYKTMDTPYMESVMWVFKTMYDKGYIYKGLRVSLFCPHCSTPISNFEVAMDPDNYIEITEPGTTYKYPVSGEKDTYFLAWSTTPWNKLATPALAVNPSLTYVKVKEGSEFYILAKSTLKILKSDKYEVVKEFKGIDLIGKKFMPHYDFYKVEPGKKAFIVIGGEFVTADEGTGIVTIAAYGEEDLVAMKENNIQIIMHVDDEGIITKDSPIGGGLSYLGANGLVNKDLEERGLIYNNEQYTHTVPTCWRCHTRLYYAPQNAWYVNIKDLKPSLEKNNKVVNWYPKHFKYGRFLKSMEAAPDWCISRSRYWGSPVPVWECDNCDEKFVPGSVAELEKESGTKIRDLHKPEIDGVTIKCKKCSGTLRRVPEVLDSWIEAGSAPYAERHFPFEAGIKLEDFFPPDFIVEYTGQIRAWFYVLHVIGTALSDSNAFKNVLVTGVVLGTDGRKMSKNFGNYPDPKEMLQKYGGDALRLYLMGSPVMHGQDVRISEEEYRNQTKEFLLILWNVYNFFVTYANVDGWVPKDQKNFVPTHIMDKWILSRLNGTVKNLQGAYEKYDTPEVVTIAKNFVVRDLSTWYVRRIRDRVGPGSQKEDKENALYTLWTALTEFSRAVAPLVPFVSEEIYRNLTNKESVHLEMWPEINEVWRNTELEDEMENIVRKAVEQAHSLRKINQIPLRQALNSFDSTYKEPKLKDLEEVLKEEINVLSVNWGSKKEKLDMAVTPELEEMTKTRDLIRKIQEERKSMGMNLTQEVDVSNSWLPTSKNLIQWLRTKTMTEKLTTGEFKVTRSS
ncbi:isoleucine--tRNA ligase [Candidatus Woesebacteria bacterium]|nr:isoleucine--tRNA ligase [Candidatus Woesebacteria bacterium]